MTNKVKEEVSIRYTDHFVADLDKEGKPLGCLEAQALSDVGTELLRTSARVYLKRLYDK